MAEQFCLKWNNYQLSLTSAFRHILEEEDFVDVTLSAGGQTLKGHKVVLSACSTYFRELLKGISPWQHPVLVLRDVPFNDLQSILEFVYLGEVNLEQRRLDSFLKTAEVLQIKGLTDGMRDNLNNAAAAGCVPQTAAGQRPPMPALKDINEAKSEQQKRPLSAASVFDIDAASALQKRLRMSDSGLRMSDDQDSMVIDMNEENGGSSGGVEFEADGSVHSGDGGGSSSLGQPGEGSTIIIDQGPPQPGVQENLGPLHKRCNVCHMIMLKKNLSRHIRDQHTVERPRSVCPICAKTYKTSDWLKDHIRRGHGYSKEDTDELMAKVKLDNNMNLGGTDSKIPLLAATTPTKDPLSPDDSSNSGGGGGGDLVVDTKPILVVPKIEVEDNIIFNANNVVSQ